MSAALVGAQRRIQLRVAQVEAGVSRGCEHVQQLGSARRQAENLQIQRVQTFEGIKHALVADSARIGEPQAQLERASTLMRALKLHKADLKLSRERLESLQQQERAAAEAARGQLRQLEMLEGKQRDLQRLKLLERERGEIEAMDESFIARASLNLGRAISVAAAPGSTVPINPDIIAKPVAQHEEAAPPLPGTSSVKVLSASDSTACSQVDLTITSTAGECVDITLLRRGESSLEVKLLSQHHGNRRRLWITRDEIFRSLKRAGYSVERFIIAGKA